MTTIVVSSGVVSSGLVISGGNELIIESGGTALSATVADGGTILDQGTVLATMVVSGGYLEAVGGIVSGGTIGAGGTANVAYFGGGDNSSGIYIDPAFAAVVSTVVDSGGVLLAAANVSGAEVQSGGFLFESAAAIYEPISGVIVQSGGLAVYIDEVYYPPNPGGTGVIISQGVIEIGTNGGANLGLSAANLAVASGDEIVVLQSGFVSGLTISSGGTADVVPNGTIAGATVNAGAVLSGDGNLANLQVYGDVTGLSTVSGAVIYAGGILDAAGTIEGGLIVESGGLAITDSSNIGSAAGNLIESGGVLSAVGLDVDDVVQSGAFEVVTGESKNAVIQSGGTVLVAAAGVLSGANVQSGAVVILETYASAYNLSGTGSGASTGVFIVSSGNHVVVNPPADTSVGSGVVEYVNSGGSTDGAVILAGGSQLVNGGVTQATELLSGAVEVVNVNGSANGTIIQNGGGLELTGGYVSGTVVASGGGLATAGGTQFDTVIKYGGEDVNEFAVSLDAVVSSASLLYVYEGKTSGTTVSAGGVEDIEQGASSLNTDVLAGGTQYIFDDDFNDVDVYGGAAIDTLVHSGGQLFNEYITSGATVLSGAVEVVLPGGTAADTDIASGAFLLLDSGLATGTTGGGQVVSGGAVVISANGAESFNPSSAVNLVGGGVEYVFGAGVASGAVIGSGAAQIVLSTASNTVIDGGAQYVSAGVAYNTDIIDGTQVVGPGFAFGASGYVPGGTDIDVTIGAAGTLVYYGGTLSGAVVFSGAGGVLYDNELALVGPGGFSYTYGPLPVISGFGVGDELVLGFAITSGTGPAISGGTLTFTDAAEGFPQSYSVTFAGDVGDQFSVTSLANGTTEVEVTALCFLAGTMIDTPGGEMPVERLAIGDMVTTHVGPRAVKWLGRRDYGQRFVAGEPMAAPVCISAGALGSKNPRRDLYVSPGHGVLVEGQLVPAWRLINGVSITQPVPAADVFYTHIELQDHAVVYAEGAPAETFLEEALRGRFQNAAEYYALYPAPAVDRENCFPRLEEGFLLQSLAQRLAKRAGVSPLSLTGRLLGAVEASGPGWVVGWALDQGNPRQPVCLDVMVYGVPVRRVLANRYRPDLRARGLGDGACGFAVELPPHLCGPISLRRSEDHALLAA